MRTKRWTRLLAFFLSVVMIVTALPTQALAYLAEKVGSITIIDKNGNTITEDESWEETFPYGTFAFGNSQLTVDEGGEQGVITLYRLGGTTGRAVAYVSYVPPSVKMEDGSISYANTAGAGDVRIWVEDPLPIAQYQPLGKDPEPLEAENPAQVSANPASDPDAEEGDQVLTLDQNASAYQWQVYYQDSWQDIGEATEQELLVSSEDIANYDFRCIYTVDGERYGSVSLNGQAYVRPVESVPEAPDDIDLHPETTYTELPMDPQNPYEGQMFSVVFADGEWAKEIHVSAPEDDTAEPEKFGLFTIEDCLGGSLYDTANTLTLHVTDNDTAGPCTVGFTVTDMEVDKADAVARLTVRREGDTTQVVKVDYETQDGTAVKGTDYISNSGSLLFYAGVTEQTIEIQLVDDKIASEERRDFQVVLTNVEGAGGSCGLEGDTAVVRLWNSGTGESDNLATLLQDGEAVDVSGGVPESGHSVAPVGAESVTGTQVDDQKDTEALKAEIVSDTVDGVAPLTYDYPAGTLKFDRSAPNYNNNYWVNELYYAMDSAESNNATHNSVGFSGVFGTWSGGNVPSGGKLLTCNYGNSGNGSISVPVTDQYFEEKFSGLYMRVRFEPEWASGWINTWYEGDEWTYPWVQLNFASNRKEYNNGGVRQDGDTLYWSRTQHLYYNWDMNEDVTSIQLGTSMHDHKASDGNANSTLEVGVLYRRKFANNLRLRIYTANDSDTHGEAALIDTALYDKNGGMQPTVSIVSGNGGVTTDGKLYAGSRLQVDLQTLESYEPGATGVNYTVFVTNSSGQIMSGAKTSKVKDTRYTIDLAWDNMNLNDTYTLNVVMTRKQDVTLDVTNSVNRLKDDPTAIDPTQVGAAWDLFWASAADGSNNVITYGTAKRSNSAPYLDSRTLETHTITQAEWNSDSAAKLTKQNLENLQWINFNRQPEDYIVFNGRMYQGNETIWLEQQDLARGTLNFLYYDQAFLSAVSAMQVNIDGAALYLDANCNGKIDGHWDTKRGIFVLDEDEQGNTLDTFLFRLDADAEYDESVFAPVIVKWENGQPVYAQYFLKVDYSLTPRCLVPSPDMDTNAKAQVLPAFITSITDQSNYNALTEEQKAYRYIISGMTKVDNGEYSRSGDDRPMYGAEATATANIDIPLGGDTSPAKINEKGTGFTWEPNYQGNLLYPFTDPEPIFIANSLAGEDIPIAQIDHYDQDTDKFTYKDSHGRTGVDLLNGYLGSFAANDTYALCVQEQVMTTDEIARANGVTIASEAGNGDLALMSEGAEAPAPDPEGSNVGDVKTMPNSEYLKQVTPGDTGTGTIDMAKSGNQFSEFNLDLGVQLPTADIGVTDFVTITMDGTQVGFSIGLPLGGYDSNGDGGASGVGNTGNSPGGGNNDDDDEGGNWTSPAGALKNSKEDMAKLLNWLKTRDMASFKENSDSYKAATASGTDKKLSAKGFAVDFSVSMAFLFEYNPLDNRFYFSQFSVTASAGLEFTAQYRFSICPIFYVYITVGVEAEIGTGATVERVSVTGEELVTGNLVDASKNMKQGQYISVTNSYKAFDIKFKGKILVEAFSDPEFTNQYAESKSGYLKSDGEDPVTVTMVRQDGQTVSTPIYLRITALEDDTSITSIKPVTKVATETSYSGFSFSPEAFVEAGVGVGVEILKFEVYIKASVGCSMVFAKETDNKVDAFSFDEFEFGLAAGFRIVLLVFSYEMDVAQYNLTYEKGEGWSQSWSAGGGMAGGDLRTLTATSRDGNTYAVHITLPGSAADTQTIYEPDYGSDSVATPFAIDPPNGKDVPFQLSGYGSSGDAFKLTDGLISGYDYQVVTAGGENYLIYTISRTGDDSALDHSMLVLSKLQLTAGTDGADSYGLTNPVNPNSDTPYILLDTTDGNGADDGTGDLEFTAWADEQGVIHAAWVSYASPTATVLDDPQDMVGQAARNTVIKTADYDPAKDQGFSKPTQLSGKANGHVFLPNVVDRNVAVYGEAVHYTQDEVTKAKEDYSAYLERIVYAPDGDAAQEASAQIGQYRLAYQEGLWNVYGKSSILNVSVGGKVTGVQLPEGQILDNLEAVKIGDTYYVVYTTSQNQYMKDGQVAAAGQANDMVTIKRLFLRTFTVGSDNTATWTDYDTEKTGSQALLLRTLYDFDVNAGNNEDGMYVGGTLNTRYTDPYFSNLQFLNAKLGDQLTGTSESFTPMSEAGNENFLLFEMNGSTYVVKQEDLVSIARSHSGRIIPFFTPAEMETEDGGTAAQSATGRMEVTIGADGAGNLSAVYVGTVQGSSSNAIYLSKYDPNTGTWGAGTMLAMNHMQVYEDAISYGLDVQQTEAAHLGQKTGNQEYDDYINGLDGASKAHAQGSMDYLTFSNLQIALGQSAQEEPDSGAATLSDGEQSLQRPTVGGGAADTLSDEPAREEASVLQAAGNGSKDTLLVITQGSFHYLKEVDEAQDGKSLSPMSDDEAQSAWKENSSPENRKPGIGVYAISYGVGEQRIGEAELSFGEYDFSAGSKLSAYVSFVNAGDVALRASSSNPLSVKLYVNSVSQPLASWEITDNVLAGQQVELTGNCAALTTDLKEGDRFYLKVQENDYFAPAANLQSDSLLTVGKKVELGFENFSVQTTGVDENGDAELYVNMEVSNRGSLDADKVYLQFSYEDGTGHYVPLDLTGNTLEVGALQELEKAAPLSDGSLENGVFLLTGEDGTSNITTGHFRQVTGTIPVPAQAYANSLTGGLNLRVEIFSENGSTETQSTLGLIEAEHDEYNISNNVRTALVPHASFFESASRVVMPMGTTMRLPVSIATTTGKAPNIAVVETPKEKENSHLGVLYYQSGSFANGRETGTLVMAPTSEGSGIVHLQDLNTNTIYAVTYTVTGTGEGINIFNDTDLFTYSHYDPTQVGNDVPWRFTSGVESWGSQTTGQAEAPMNADLAYGKVGENFQFVTQAESIRLYFDGQIQVSSTFPNFATKTYTADGGKNGYVDIFFGKNQTNYTHTVTVTVTGGQGQNDKYAAFDRIIMTYGTAGTPIPAQDAEAPHIYWSRSFPDTASVKTGDSVSLQAFVLDDNGIANVTVNGSQIGETAKNSSQFWTVPVTVTENGDLTVSATDISGNITTSRIQVGWFLDQPQEGTSSCAPGLTDVGFSRQNTNQYELHWNATASANAGETSPTVTVKQIVAGKDGGLTEETFEGTAVTSNGWYLVTATDRAPHDGQWSAQMVAMEQIDTTIPTVTLNEANDQTQSDGGVDLNWSVKKDTSDSTSAATIVTATMNQYGLTFSSGQTWVGGTWHATHGGKYTVQAEDSAGNKNSASLELKNVPVYVKDGETFYKVTNSDNDEGNNGSITVDPSVLLGGTYDPQKSDAAKDKYVGTYEWRLVKNQPDSQPESQPEADGLAVLLSEDEAWGSETTFDNLTPGSYTIYVRDANDDRNEETVLQLQLELTVDVGDERINLTLEDQTESTGTGNSSSSSDGNTTVQDDSSERHTLHWSAEKGEKALQPITSVAINGQTMDAGSGLALSGTLPIQFGGTYVLTASDDTRVTARKELAVKNVSITVSDRGSLVTIQHPWNLAADNGTVTVHWTDSDGKQLVTGGLFDPEASEPAAGSYVGRYQWRLEKPYAFDSQGRLTELTNTWLKDHPNEGQVPQDVLDQFKTQVQEEADQGRKQWMEDLLAENEGWKDSSDCTLTGQKAGDYTLLIRDAQDPTNAETLFTTPVTLNNEHITATAETESAREGQNNGSVMVTASGGYLNRNTYQYILRPITDESAAVGVQDMTSPLNQQTFPETVYTQPQWVIPDFTRLTDPNQITDTSYNLLNSITMSGLPSGWYEVAVRPMLDVGADELLNLARLAAAYTAADTVAKEAAGNATQDAMQRQVEQKVQALSQALNDWRGAEEDGQTAAEAAYKALIGNDETILSALEAWQEAGFASGDAQNTYNEAVEKYFTDQVTNACQQAADETAQALEQAKNAYEAEYSQLMKVTDAAYATEEGEIGWNNSTTLTVYVDRVTNTVHAVSNDIQTSDLRYPDENTVTVNFTSSKRALSAKAERQLIADNATRKIVATSAVMKAIIPAGTLKDGDDVSAMLMPFAQIPADTFGTVVQYTTPEGKTVRLPWSVITLNKVWYIASQPGTYEIVTNPVTFSDVPEDFWGYDAVTFAAARNLFQGEGNDLFVPGGTMNRAMLVTVLGRLAGIDPADYAGESAFTDVETDSWYGPYVAWASQNGIVQGVGSGLFAPDAPITREQLCTMLVRYLDDGSIHLPVMEHPPVFQDENQVSSWAEESVDRFRQSGIVEGTNSMFLPDNDASRAEVAAIFSRLITAVLTDG